MNPWKHVGRIVQTLVIFLGSVVVGSVVSEGYRLAKYPDTPKHKVVYSDIGGVFFVAILVSFITGLWLLIKRWRRNPTEN